MEAIKALPHAHYRTVFNYGAINETQDVDNQYIDRHFDRLSSCVVGLRDNKEIGMSGVQY